MRLIDADALKAKYEQMLPEIGDGYHKETLQDVLFELEYAPTISPDEVRGVVHCHECDLWNRWDSAGRESLGNLTCSCAHWTVEDGTVIRTKPTDFCSYGERMVSEDA